MDFKDMEYFDQLMEKHLTYRISDFNCEYTKSWHQTIPNPTSLRFGRFRKFENIPNHGFPNHFFRFISYDQLFSRLTKNSILTDYIGSVQTFGPLIESGNPNKNQTVRRSLDIENLNGNAIKFTMWDEIARDFDKDAFQSIPKPIILAISSCQVTKYNGSLQLSATPATCYYFKPNIPEVAESIAKYKATDEQNPPLNVTKQRYDDRDKEKTRNRFPLHKLLSQNPATYKLTRFTCEGTIVDFNTSKGWYYNSCTICNKKYRMTVLYSNVEITVHNQIQITGTISEN